MSENCTHDCSSCSADCSSRDMRVPANAMSSIKRVIAVVSGKGGVGKSTVTASLAVAMAKKGRKVAILDADITGPSIPTAFGIHQKATGTDAGIDPAVTAGGIKLMSLNLLTANETDPVIWREGGAGAFSDGKLNTGTRDIRHRFILEQLVACGAPEDILVDAKPHVGTDYLHIALKGLRRELLDLGADIRFESRLADLEIQNGVLTGITVEGPEGTYSLPCTHLVLCPGHSARDTFAMLHDRGVPMEAKPFAVGVRIEHPQAAVNAAQYRQYAGHPGLPASSYKLSCHLPNGRSAFSFCVCPGGEVVAAASEPGRVVTNGMSEFARDKENINGALLVNVTPEDFGGGDDPLAGIAFQRKLEEAAFALGGGGFRAPAQRVGDFLSGRPSQGPGAVAPSYRPGVTWCDLHECLPDFVAEALAQALPLLGQKLRGYDDPDAVMTAVESRSSSPVRIPRDESYQSALRGLYPCGEGAGYAGGILSAAADGMRAAEHICQSIQQEVHSHES